MLSLAQICMWLVPNPNDDLEDVKKAAMEEMKSVMEAAVEGVKSVVSKVDKT